MGAALSRFGVSDLSQSINYTFNLNRITLVRDISNLQKVGAMHYMETHGGCCTSEESNNPQRAAEARELLERGNGILTDYGLLFINDEVPFEPVYNGVNFPEYWYEGMDKTGIELTYQDRKEYLYIQNLGQPVVPCTERERLQSEGIGDKGFRHLPE